MRVRRSRTNGNGRQEPVSHSSPNGGHDEPPVPPDPVGQHDRGRQAGGPGPLLSLRSAVILGASVLVSGCAGILTYLLVGSIPAAVLAAAPAFGGAVSLFNGIISS